MNRKRMTRLIIAMATLAVVTWFLLPRKADLRAFDAMKMAEVEVRSWRHYYEKRWASLFADLYEGSREGYGFSPCDSCLIALHAARAAKVFQPSRSRAEAQMAVPLLEDYFRVIARGAHATFDIKEAARTELEWWQLRREDKTWQKYGRAIAKATGVLYDTDPRNLEAGCLKRAKMMEFRDGRGKAIAADDWRMIEEGLREAWRLTREAVQPAR